MPVVNPFKLELTRWMFPAFLVGYEIDHPAEPEPPEPEWLVHWTHSYGGTEWMETHLSGVLYRLWGNADQAARDPEELRELVTAFHAQGDTWMDTGAPAGPIPRNEEILRLFDTLHESPLPKRSLENLDALLGHYFDGLPALESGDESLVTFGDADPAFFRNWACLCVPAEWNPAEFLSVLSPGEQVEWDRRVGAGEDEWVAMRRMRPLTTGYDTVLPDGEGAASPVVLALEKLARRLDIGRPPRLYLVWENGD